MNWKPIEDHPLDDEDYLGWSKEDGIMAFAMIDGQALTGLEGTHFGAWEFKPTHFTEYETP